MRYRDSLLMSHQVLQMRATWSNLKVTLTRAKLVAVGSITPSGISQTYQVRLEYQWGASPKVYVDSPPLGRRALAPDTPIPHTYDDLEPGKERPCLFYPGADWNPAMSLAKTIVPWLMSWLLDYELWHATSKWLGGGIEHTKQSRRAS